MSIPRLLLIVLIVILVFAALRTWGAEPLVVVPGFTAQSAEARSRVAMMQLQTLQTRNDTNTVTKFLFNWRQNTNKNDWAIELPVSQTNRLTSAELARVRARGPEWEPEDVPINPQ